MQENRRQRRVPMKAEARVTRLATGEGIDAVLVDISHYGVCIKTTSPLKNREKILLSITLEREIGTARSEEVPGTVRWVEHRMKMYSAGISFDQKVNGATFPLFNECIEYTRVRR